MSREDVKIPGGNDLMVAWLYPAAGAAPGAKSPAIVLGQGLGGVKEMRLYAHCERLSQAGFVCLAFDYRYWGGSTGKPRGLVDPEAQIQDWNAALAYAASLPQVDASRIGIFGTSFSGGHAIRLAATNPLVKAAVSQCPFTDGMVSSATPGISNMLKLALLGLRDILFGTDDEPVRVRLFGRPGEVALMTTPDAYEGCLSLLPPGMEKPEIEAIPARLTLYFPFLFPGSYAKQVKCPILFAICGKDTLTPPETTLNYVKQAPKGVIKTYADMTHFDIYSGEAFETVIVEYLRFYQANL